MNLKHTSPMDPTNAPPYWLLGLQPPGDHKPAPDPSPAEPLLPKVRHVDALGVRHELELRFPSSSQDKK